MPNYTVTDPVSNRTVTLTGDSPPTEAELTEVFANLPQSQAQTPSSPSLGDTVMAAAKSLNPVNIAKNLTPEKMSPYLPAAGATIGSAIAPGVGTAAGAGLGQIGSRMADLAYGRVQPADAMNPRREAIAPMVQAGLSGLPEVTSVKNAIQSAAQNLGRRALGITKGMIKRMPGGVDAANKSAQEMLDQGVIQPLSSSGAMLERAQDVADTSGKAIGQTLAKAGGNALDTNEVGKAVIDQLAPKFQGGDYAAQEKIANEIVDTISAHGNGPIDFESAQTLKNTLKQAAGNNWNTDKMKAAMYQRAYGIVNKAIEDGLDKAVTTSASEALPVVQPGLKTGDPHALFAYNDKMGEGGAARAIYNVYGDPAHPAIQTRGWGSSVTKADVDAAGIPITGMEPRAVGKLPAGTAEPLPADTVSKYIANKRTYGASQVAIEGLADRAAAEASNSILSLRGAAIGAGALASGHVTPALEALGVWEGARRVGAGTGAAALDYLNNAPLATNVRRALLSEFINRVQVGKKKEGQ